MARSVSNEGGTGDTGVTAIERSRHVEVLAISAIAIVGAFTLTIGEDGDRVYTMLSSTVPLARTCFTKEVLGVSCPGCGLTRSFIHLADLQWAAAWQMHRLGWLLFFATLVQVPYRLLALSRGYQLPKPVGKGIGSWLVGLLIANWVYGLIVIGPMAGN